MKKFLLLGLLVSTVANAMNFHVEPKYINTGNDFNKLCGDNCPALNYGLISTNDLWVQHTINKSVLSIFGTAGEEKQRAGFII